jgi:long-subunit acyl-CoA synthetase (AMP-forming)
MVENICVYGDPYRKRTVAIVVPSQSHVQALANKMGLTENFEQLCVNTRVRDAVLRQICAAGMHSGE